MRRIDARTLRRWIVDGGELALLDAREEAEFATGHPFWSVCCPLSRREIRARALLPRLAVRVVCSDAGGGLAEALAAYLQGIGCTDVAVLEGGLPAWAAAGYALFTGVNVPSAAFAAWVEQHYGPASVEWREFQACREPGGEPALSLTRAKQFAEASGVGVLGPIDLARYEEDAERTCYVLDVRDAAAFAAGHRPGSVSAPGDALLRGTDRWLGVRGARVALIDQARGPRARCVGAWLRQMGHRDVFAVEGGLDEATVPGSAPVAVPELHAPADTIGADALAEAADLLVLDLTPSSEFRLGHIPGARWGLRSRLAVLRGVLAGAKGVVLTSPEGVQARLAVGEVGALTAAPVRVLQGGTAAWLNAGRRLESSPDDPPDAATVDVWQPPAGRDWSAALPAAVAREGSVSFGVPRLDD
jgi:rhodanese-related sulfurtransferase